MTEAIRHPVGGSPQRIIEPPRRTPTVPIFYFATQEFIRCPKLTNGATRGAWRAPYTKQRRRGSAGAVHNATQRLKGLWKRQAATRRRRQAPSRCTCSAPCPVGLRLSIDSPCTTRPRHRTHQSHFLGILLFFWAVPYLRWVDRTLAASVRAWPADDVVSLSTDVSCDDSPA